MCIFKGQIHFSFSPQIMYLIPGFICCAIILFPNIQGEVNPIDDNSLELQSFCVQTVIFLGWMKVYIAQEILKEELLLTHIQQNWDRISL